MVLHPLDLIARPLFPYVGSIGLNGFIAYVGFFSWIKSGTSGTSTFSNLRSSPGRDLCSGLLLGGRICGFFV
jgi:hypothetical protein